MYFYSNLLLVVLATVVNGKLTGSVGPLTSSSYKAAIKTCNVLDYGATNDNTTDVGQPIIDAFADCGGPGTSGGVVYVPEGDYLLDTWVDLSNGTTWALQLDGVIYRNSTPSSEGYMFTISDGSDFELFSSTSEGAKHGNSGRRLRRT
jgi:rhamnogalacturonan hydrolase